MLRKSRIKTIDILLKSQTSKFKQKHLVGIEKCTDQNKQTKCNPMLEFQNNLWGLGTEYEQVCRTARKATRLAEWNPGLLEGLKIRLRAQICKRLRSLGIDFLELIPLAYLALRVNINRVVRLARLHRLAESMLGNSFLGSLKVNKFGLRMHHAYTREYR